MDSLPDARYRLSNKNHDNSERAHVDASRWGDELHKVMLTNHGKSVANIEQL